MIPTITVCGLGPGGDGDLTEATAAAIAAADQVFLRTDRHPTAGRVTDASGFVETFDAVYDAGDSLAEVYQKIADRLVEVATSSSESVLYVVPGSPLVLERSVAHLRADDRIKVELVPSLSFLDVAWARLGIDPVEERVRLIDGHVFEQAIVGEGGPVLVAHAHARWVLSDIKLALDAGPEQTVTVLKALGTEAEEIFEVSWPELDRSFEPDHLTSLFIGKILSPVGEELSQSVELMHRLRQECPWDAKQTHESLRQYLIEEAYETLEAIDQVVAEDADGYLNLEEELGDLWFQILFHSELAAEAGEFTINDVARTAYDKLVGRHPHVFGDAGSGVVSAEDVVANWETIKKHEKGRSSIMDGMPVALPALLLANKMLEKGARSSAPADPDLVSKQIETCGKTDLDQQELGQLLLALVERSRVAGLDPEGALNQAAHSAMVRYRAAEADGTVPTSWVFG